MFNLIKEFKIRRQWNRDKNIFFCIPLEVGEKEGACENFFMDGVRFKLEKGKPIKVPEYVAKLLNERLEHIRKNKTNEDFAQEIIDLFFEKGAEISKKEYDQVLEILANLNTKVREDEKDIIRKKWHHWNWKYLLNSYLGYK